MFNVSIRFISKEEQEQSSGGLFLSYEDKYKAIVTDAAGNIIMSHIYANSKADLLRLIAKRMDSEQYAKDLANGKIETD